MSIFLEKINNPLWIGIFIGVAVLLIILIIVIFKKSSKSDSLENMKADVFKKATEHSNTQNKLRDAQGNEGAVAKNNVLSNVEQTKKYNIRTVLLDLAERGEAGVLPKSISDKTGISSQETTSSLNFLIEHHYAEVTNNPSGKKYYLTEAGRKFCLSKEFNTEFS